MDGSRLVDPARYSDLGYPHAEWAALRRDAPVKRFEPDGWPAFWAITRHADIVEISKDPDRYLNGPGMTYVRETRPDGDGNPPQMKTIINMDPPEHRKYRKIASPYFTPRALAQLDELVAVTARQLVDGLGAEGECDFITEIAARHPLKVLAHILGIPEEHEPLILKLTNELFGSDDPELARESQNREEAIRSLFMDFHGYFSQVVEERRARPGDDFASVIANARIDGEPMGPIETMGYCLITFTAGHETTRGGIGGGLLALIENPRERARWAADLSMTPTAIDEIIRYVTPVNHMVRTASEDCVLAGQKISEGDRLVLFYASANRDEAVFEAPDTLRLDRNPNPHLAFGIGEHFCLGAHLARKTSGAIFRELVSRLEHLELAGKPERTASILVPGLKHLPIAYKLGPPRIPVRELSVTTARRAA